MRSWTALQMSAGELAPLCHLPFVGCHFGLAGSIPCPGSHRFAGLPTNTTAWLSSGLLTVSQGATSSQALLVASCKTPQRGRSPQRNCGASHPQQQG